MCDAGLVKCCVCVCVVFDCITFFKISEALKCHQTEHKICSYNCKQAW